MGISPTSLTSAAPRPFSTRRQRRYAELEKAKVASMETARTEGKPIPKPRYGPAIYQSNRV